MKKLRQLHTYLGVFFAPLLLFFVCTGWYQTLHPDRRKSPEEAEAFWEKARSVHADSVLPNPKAESYATRPFRYFTVAMSTGFVITTVVGVILAFRFTKNKWAIFASLVFGLAIPVVMLIMGQKIEPSASNSPSATEKSGGLPDTAAGK